MPTGLIRRRAGLTTVYVPAYDVLLATYSPSAWWKLADGSGATAAADSSGNGHTGTASGVTFGVAGPIPGKTAASFVPGSKITTAFDFTPSAGTIIAWYKLTTNTGNQFPVTTGSSGTKGFWINLASGKPYCIIYPATGAGLQAIWGSTPSAATWHMIAMTWDGTTWKVSVDGGAFVTATGGTGAMTAGDQHVGIGYDLDSNNYLTGSIAEVALIPSALTIAEVQALYAAA